MDRVHQPHPDERYDAEDESWQAPRKIERFFSQLNSEGWIFDRPSHVYVVAADGTGAPRNLTPGEFQHDGRWRGCPTPPASSLSAQRHDTWDLDFAADLYSVPLDGDDRRAVTHSTGNVRRARRVAPTAHASAFIGADDSQTYPQNVHVGVVPIDGGEHRWLSRQLDRTFETTAGGWRRVWLDDTTTAGRGRGPRRDPPLSSHARRCRAEGRHDRSRSPSTRSMPRAAPSRTRPAAVDAVERHLRASVTARPRRLTDVRRQLSRDRPAQHVGAVRRAVRRRHRRDRRVDHAAGRVRRDRRRTRCCSTSTAARTRSTARRSSTRRRCRPRPGSSC